MLHMLQPDANSIGTELPKSARSSRLYEHVKSSNLPALSIGMPSSPVTARISALIKETVSSSAILVQSTGALENSGGRDAGGTGA